MRAQKDSSLVEMGLKVWRISCRGCGYWAQLRWGSESCCSLSVVVATVCRWSRRGELNMVSVGGEEEAGWWGVSGT